MDITRVTLTEAERAERATLQARRLIDSPSAEAAWFNRIYPVGSEVAVHPGGCARMAFKATVAAPARVGPIGAVIRVDRFPQAIDIRVVKRWEGPQR